MLEKACFCNSFLHRFSSISDLKIHRFWHAFWSLLLSKYQKCKTLEICILPRWNHCFEEVELWKNHQNASKKGYKMRVPKKHPKNLSKNRFWEPFWPPKPLQNRRKTLSKTMSKKDSKKTASRTLKKNPPASDPAKHLALPPSDSLPF